LGANLYRTLGMRRQVLRDRVQVFHGLSNEIPLDLVGSGVKTILTVHDLLFLDLPRTYPWLDRQIYRFKTQSGLAKADRVVAISPKTMERLVHYFPQIQNRVEVIYQPCAPEYYQDPWSQATSHHSIPEEPYWLYVGNIEARKNLRGILQALRALPPSERLPLVIIGRGGAEAVACRQMGREWGLDLRWTAPTNGNLRLWYQRATALIYPSLAEGFGLPVAEALLSGCPVVTSIGTSMAEFSGSHAVLVNPNDTDSLVWGLQQSQTAEYASLESRQRARQAILQLLDPTLLTQKWLDLYQQIS
jgi:glycosyltransferase involved in cell wall biosynthesis